MKSISFTNRIFNHLKIVLLTVVFSCSNPNDIVPPPPDVGYVPETTVESIPFDDLLSLTQYQTFKYFWIMLTRLVVWLEKQAIVLK